MMGKRKLKLRVSNCTRCSGIVKEIELRTIPMVKRKKTTEEKQREERRLQEKRPLTRKEYMRDSRDRRVRGCMKCAHQLIAQKEVEAAQKGAK